MTTTSPMTSESTDPGVPALPVRRPSRSASRKPRHDLQAGCLRESHLESCYVTLGRWVRRRRLRTDLTQIELGRRLGVSREWVAGVEGGFQRVYFHQVLALADLFEREARRQSAYGHR